MPILILFVAHWFLSLFTQTFFHHRYAAHRMFFMSRFGERFFYLLTFIAQGPSFLVPRAYGVLHRMHHAYSDTEKDPHSPHFFKDPFRLMWQTKLEYAGLVKRTIKPPEEFAQNLPEWESLDRFGDSMITRILWGTFYSLFYLYFASSYWLLFLLPVHFIMGVIHGAIVNWCGHLYGYRNFPLRDRSRNSLPVDFLMMGELYQNNHHRDPNRPDFAVRWFEFDPAYPVIWLLNRLKIIRLRANPDAAPAYAAESYQAIP
jgi:stearoyl-CoA desaturase (Delta-9 desaturase)